MLTSYLRAGFISQALAAGWHYKSSAQLAELGDKIGRDRIMVVHGGLDRMITFPHGEELLEALGGEKSGVTKKFEPGQGHVIPIEKRKEFGEWIEDLVRKAEELNKA
jgi:predicted esterase